MSKIYGERPDETVFHPLNEEERRTVETVLSRRTGRQISIAEVDFDFGVLYLTQDNFTVAVLRARGLGLSDRKLINEWVFIGVSKRNPTDPYSWFKGRMEALSHVAYSTPVPLSEFLRTGPLHQGA